jgi:hypothetical protein
MHDNVQEIRNAWVAVFPGIIGWNVYDLIRVKNIVTDSSILVNSQSI